MDYQVKIDNKKANSDTLDTNKLVDIDQSFEDNRISKINISNSNHQGTIDFETNQTLQIDTINIEKKY